MQEQELHDLYVLFLGQNTELFAAGQFEVAYHVLAAAMHCANSLRDGGLLEEVQHRAQEQGEWIDRHAAEHPLSSRNAHFRNNESIYVSAARQAHAMLLGLRVDQQAEKVRRLNERALSPEPKGP
jgi:hypothetical protein